MKELDHAAPKHPVYISGTGGGTGAITNTLGRTFLISKGVAVDETSGTVSQANAAIAALQTLQTEEDRAKRLVSEDPEDRIRINVRWWKSRICGCSVC